MPGRTMVVGLTDLIDNYFFVFIKALHEAKEDRNVTKQEQQVKTLRFTAFLRRLRKLSS
jgi:hypothetical protein